MQQRKPSNKALQGVVYLLIAACVAVPVRTQAQTSSVNSYSPYTMYGVGELSTPGALPMRSMGGIGVAWRSTQTVNLLNPAGYSATARKSMLFDFGVEGMYIRNTQNKYAEDGAYAGKGRNAKNSINFHEIAFQLPLAKRLGMGFSLTPYSSVGYNMTTTEQNEDIWGSVGRARYNYYGDGDVTEVKAGIGWEIAKNLSIGAAAMYYWGDIQHNYTSQVSNNIVGDGSYNSVLGVDDYSVSHFNFQAGVQWNAIASDRRMLTFGATYDLGGKLNPKVKQTVYLNNIYSTSVTSNDSRGQMRLPQQVAAGVFYQDAHYKAGVDYVFQSWGAKDSKFTENIYGGMKVTYQNTNTVKVGFEYTPNRFDVRRYFNRMSYRFGGRYGTYYQQYGGQSLNQYAVTFGIGFPLKFMGASLIDFGIEYGGRGSDSSIYNNVGQRVGLVRQQYIKFSIGISMFGEDYWFVRPKYD